MRKASRLRPTSCSCCGGFNRQAQSGRGAEAHNGLPGRPGVDEARKCGRFGQDLRAIRGVGHVADERDAEVLAQAREAAQGKDVRLGGGVTTVREFLDADLVDALHVVVTPVELGSGLRLWDSPDELLDRFHLEVVPSPSGVTHHLFWRR